jgi:hypothetical protein
MLQIIQINKYVINCVVMYVLCTSVHYFASHLYILLCVPCGLKGFLMSPFLTLSPHCQALRWIIYNGGFYINTMWFLLGGWLLNKCQTTFFRLTGNAQNQTQLTPDSCRVTTRSMRLKKTI